MSLLVGLTGGMGSGKTVAASFFKELGAHILDADLICRKLTEPGQPAWVEISEQFGKEIFDSSGNLDRKKLAEIVFFDQEKKRILEGILHPKVFEYEKREYGVIRRQCPNALVILDAALLIESGNNKNMDKVVVVNSDEKTRITRILARSELSHKEVMARIKAQMPNEEKLKYADFILQNNSSQKVLKAEVKSLHKLLSQLALENTGK